MSRKTIKGQIVDLLNRVIYPGVITIEGKRLSPAPCSDVPSDRFIMPGFVDGHIHIESSMLTPSSFGAAALKHGTVAVAADPHEIANVLGVRGIEFMLKDAARTPLKIYYGVPSCVPATPFEASGAVIDCDEVSRLLALPGMHFLAEMMNFPGVIAGAPEVISKIDAARRLGKPVDGHAPGLSGDALRRYIGAGISTDHECTTLEEALEKLKLGLKIAIREGSAARNFDALITLLDDYPEDIFFCSDDLHPDDLVQGHINRIVRRAVRDGSDLWKVLGAACLNPVLHYKMDVGLLREGDPADFIIVSDLSDFSVQEVWIEGCQVVSKGCVSAEPQGTPVIKKSIACSPISQSDVELPATGSTARVIQVLDGELITRTELLEVRSEAGLTRSDVTRDLLKLVVLNRYQKAPPAIALVRGFGLRRGALASSIAHDSHNIIAVGVEDADIVAAINLLIENQGGIIALTDSEEALFPLPIAGLMSSGTAEQAAQGYAAAQRAAHAFGCSLQAPFMTLSFLSLLVIPELKLGDKGLFDVTRFEFVPLFV